VWDRARAENPSQRLDLKMRSIRIRDYLSTDTFAERMPND
jgi:hypothetical protein